MAVPKKRTSMSKKRIRKNIWKKKGYFAAVKAFSLAKSVSTGNSKTVFVHEPNKFFVRRKKSLPTRKPKPFSVRKRNK
uniref:Large ribosomal subunit protein bL32c n=1 Tax=Sagittaria trifolia TaxID=63789 RepID=A0A513U1M6_9LILI|nr:ribosomal protein L32 [Sagittaria trifolia]YP_010518710.1 ribosomal protein L32 [Sagittaria graminea]QDG01525.1 ribosomal protein L32 [Sagittaria trifolia]UDZ61009.1 ribosomal protein L32 [Sagittaria trifolia]UXO94324.1 ribosomal protein L32 [Sagittaria graminea]